MTVESFSRLQLGDNLTGTDLGAGTIRIDAAAGGVSPSDTAAWLPLTTVVAGVPELVWDASDSLIPTYTTI